MPSVSDELGQIVKTFQQSLADKKLTLSEFLTLVVAVVRAAVNAAERLDTLTGAEKKAFVLEAVSVIYDAVAAVVSIPWVPRFLSVLLLQCAKPAVMTLASEVVELVVATLE